MINLSKQREFLYKLGDKYYVIGSHTCEECHISSIIDIYEEYLIIINDPLFVDYNEYNMNTVIKSKAGNLYSTISEFCFISDREKTMNEINRRLLYELESLYSNEIEQQFNHWIKAEKCFLCKPI